MSTPLTRGQVQNRLTRLSNSTKYAAVPCHGYIAELADTDDDLRQQLTQAQARIDMLEAEAGYHGAKEVIEQLQQQLATAQAHLESQRTATYQAVEREHHAKKRVQTLEEAAEFMWICLVNVSGGNWELQSHDWQRAVKKARDDYFKALATPAAEKEA